MYKSIMSFSLRITSSNIRYTTLENSCIKHLQVGDHSNTFIKNYVAESNIKSIDVYHHSNVVIEDGQNSGYCLYRDGTSRVFVIGPVY